LSKVLCHADSHDAGADDSYGLHRGCLLS
jgi:hypothetical protein